MPEHYDVGEFHQKFGLDNTNISTPGPRRVNKELFDFRVKFMEEELQEFKDAAAAGDHAGMFDALMDLTYVACGFAHVMGYPWQEGWNMVQAANMAKVRATVETASERGGTWDVVKPPGWLPPDIDKLMRVYGFPATHQVTVCVLCKEPILDSTEAYNFNNTPNYIQTGHYSCVEKEGLL